MVLSVVTGMRLGEIFALRWADVDLGDDPVIHMRGSLQRVDGRLQIVEPETAGSVRDVALVELGQQALRRHRNHQMKHRLQLVDSWEEHDLVLPNAWGRFMATDYFVRRDFGRILETAALPRIRFHDLRATFATLQLGNEQSAQMQRKAADALDAVLRADDASSAGAVTRP